MTSLLYIYFPFARAVEVFYPFVLGGAGGTDTLICPLDQKEQGTIQVNLVAKVHSPENLHYIPVTRSIT